jgi:hypothetical protein
MTFREHLDYKEYVFVLENIDSLNEGVFSNVKDSITKKAQFVNDLVQASKMNVQKITQMLKNTKVYKFFAAIGFSIKTLYDYVKKGFEVYIKIQKDLAKFVAESKFGKYSKDVAQRVDAFLYAHPIIKKLSGVLVGALLLYIWLNMSFTGDANYDFNYSDIIQAVMGKFSVEQLFTGEDGFRMLILLASGTLGLSFPWPGNQIDKMTIAVINGIRNII